MKRTTLMKWALAGLITAGCTGTGFAADDAAPPERPARAPIRERLRGAPPEEREAVRERLRDATPEQRRAARERIRDATPEQRRAARERFGNASPEERRAMVDRLVQPRRPGRPGMGPGPADSPRLGEFRGPRGSRGFGRGPAVGPPGPLASGPGAGMNRPGGPAPRQRLALLREKATDGTLTPEEQRQLSRLEQWGPPRDTGPGRRGGRGPGGPGGLGRGGPGPRAGGPPPASER